jgi:hypothetical protein
MPTLDFKEIPSARASTDHPGEQDTYELFARDVLEHIGFRILSDPNRGPDEGKDIIVEELRRGVGGETTVKWLVSCKHYAHSGKSVSPDDELNICERVKQHGCNGFMGFYSTIPSSGLSKLLEGQTDIDIQIYDHERIERTLLGSSEGNILARRFFPVSIKMWEFEPTGPSDVMIDMEPLLCDYSGENLLEPTPQGIIALVRRWESEGEKRHYTDVYWCLKGEPDRALRSKFEDKEHTTEWEDIPDIIMPVMYIRWYMSLLNQIRDGHTFSDSAFEKLKEFLITIYPFVARNMRPEEKERVDRLMMVPSWAGGFG